MAEQIAFADVDLPTSLPPNELPPDDYDVPAYTTHATIFYLTINNPHTDSFIAHSPARNFTSLLPRIHEAVANSPAAVEKLKILREDPAFEFDRLGFSRFTVPLQNGTYSMLKIEREVNPLVFDTLPAPVYVVIASGPLLHDRNAGQRLVASGRPKGVAKTSRVIGSFIRREEARETAKRAMDGMIEGKQGVRTMERGDQRTGALVLVALSAEAVWEVYVRFEQERIDNDGGMRWRF